MSWFVGGCYCFVGRNSASGGRSSLYSFLTAPAEDDRDTEGCDDDCRNGGVYVGGHDCVGSSLPGLLVEIEWEW